MMSAEKNALIYRSHFIARFFFQLNNEMRVFSSKPMTYVKSGSCPLAVSDVGQASVISFESNKNLLLKSHSIFNIAHLLYLTVRPLL